jgi:hypothetical protein
MKTESAQKSGYVFRVTERENGEKESASQKVGKVKKIIEVLNYDSNLRATVG